ncbi:MAG: hypothetical protein GY898_20680 [Proteobacteria bacterium]|nr:hypothetical protein [Pseudomonadota bacterium]
MNRCATLAIVLMLTACSGGWDDDDDATGPVFQASLVGIGVTPMNPTVTLGEQIQFVATGFYDDTSTRDITDTVEWYTTDSNVIDVSSGLDSEGRGTPLAAGVARVSCGLEHFPSNDVVVTVTDAQITSLVIQPSTVQLHSGETVQLEAVADFSDGSHGNVTGTVRWTAENGGAATVDSNGIVTASNTLGTATVGVVYDSAQGEFVGTPAVIEVLDGSVSIDEADVRILGVNPVSTGDGVTYSVEVKNSGGSPASGFWLDVWLNRTAAPPPPPATGDAYEFVSLLEAGESTFIELALETTPGNYQSWLMIDSFDTVAEDSLGENNNIWGPEPVQVTSGGGPIGPDLAVTYLQAFVQEAQEQVLYIVDVTNTGDQAAAAFNVGVFSDPAFPPVAPAYPDEQAYVDLLPPGETAYLDIAIRDVPDGFWQSYVLADVAGTIEEPNESNNLANFQVVP